MLLWLIKFPILALVAVLVLPAVLVTLFPKVLSITRSMLKNAAVAALVLQVALLKQSQKTDYLHKNSVTYQQMNARVSCHPGVYIFVTKVDKIRLNYSLIYVILTLHRKAEAQN